MLPAKNHCDFLGIFQCGEVCIQCVRLNFRLFFSLLVEPLPDLGRLDHASGSFRKILFLDHRECHPEFSADTGFRVDIDFGAVSVADLVDYCKPEARALAGLLGCIERFLLWIIYYVDF